MILTVYSADGMQPMPMGGAAVTGALRSSGKKGALPIPAEGRKIIEDCPGVYHIPALLKDAGDWDADLKVTAQDGRDFKVSFPFRVKAAGSRDQ